MLTTFMTVYFFWRASKSKTALVIISGWLLLQTCISLTGFYKITNSIPPRFVLLVLPPVLVIIVLFTTKKGNAFINHLDTGWLTLLHVVRIPVELVLFSLAICKLVPVIMTFEGHNPDIISGITAAIIYYYGFVKRKMNRSILIIWNFICLGLLINIVTIAILSAPFAFQRLAFAQPNIAILSFPFVWLPGCIVPLVLFSHLVMLKKLISEPATVLHYTY